MQQQKWCEFSCRFPQFKIPKRPWSKSSGRENFFLSHQLHFQKLDPNKSCSRISAYDNLSCDRFNFSKSGNDSDKSSEINCDSFTNSSTNYDQQSKLSESENLSKNHTLSETLKHKRRLDCGSMTEDNEDAQTIFSEPWDSSRWENLLPSSADCSKESCFGGNHNVEATFTSEVADSVYESTKNFNKITKKGYKEKMDFPLCE